VTSDEDPPIPTIRVGAEGISGGEGRDRGDILKEKPHLVNTDNVSVSYYVCVLVKEYLYPQESIIKLILTYYKAAVCLKLCECVSQEQVTYVIAVLYTCTCTMQV
jgi:hypothetical protein